MVTEYKCIDCGEILERDEISMMGFQGFACGKCGGRIIIYSMV